MRFDEPNREKIQNLSHINWFTMLNTYVNAKEVKISQLGWVRAPNVQKRERQLYFRYGILPYSPTVHTLCNIIFRKFGALVKATFGAQLFIELCGL